MADTRTGTSAVDLTLQPKRARLINLMRQALADNRFFDANGYRHQLEQMSPGDKRWIERRERIDWTFKGECRRERDRRAEDRDG